jgi:two-component system phosphate regulon sensor histidine kinase PhoR
MKFDEGRIRNLGAARGSYYPILMASAKPTPVTATALSNAVAAAADSPEGTGDEAEADNVSEGLAPLLRMLDGLTDACMVVEADGRMRYANEAARTLLRMKGRAKGRKLAAVLADRPALEVFEDAVAAGRPRAAVLALTLSSDGARHYTVSAVPVPVPGEGQLLRVALCSTNEGPAHPASRSSDETTVVLEKLGDPLSIIQGYLENLLDGVIKEPAVMRQCLSAMQRQATQMQRVLSGLRV